MTKIVLMQSVSYAAVKIDLENFIRRLGKFHISGGTGGWMVPKDLCPAATSPGPTQPIVSLVVTVAQYQHCQGMAKSFRGGGIQVGPFPGLLAT